MLNFNIYGSLPFLSYSIYLYFHRSLSALKLIHSAITGDFIVVDVVANDCTKGETREFLKLGRNMPLVFYIPIPMCLYNSQSDEIKLLGRIENK